MRKDELKLKIGVCRLHVYHPPHNLYLTKPKCRPKQVYMILLYITQVMFDLARYHAPSTIFLDEIDALASKRDSSSHTNEHEASRRLKTELLIQLDGLSQTDDQVFLLATSNLPW